MINVPDMTIILEICFGKNKAVLQGLLTRKLFLDLKVESTSYESFYINFTCTQNMKIIRFQSFENTVISIFQKRKRKEREKIFYGLK